MDDQGICICFLCLMRCTSLPPPTPTKYLFFCFLRKKSQHHNFIFHQATAERAWSRAPEREIKRLIPCKANWAYQKIRVSVRSQKSNSKSLVSTGRQPTLLLCSMAVALLIFFFMADEFLL